VDISIRIARCVDKPAAIANYSLMTADQIQAMLSGAGTILGFAGSLVLAFSVNKPLTMLRTHVLALDTTVQANFGPGDVPIFTGLDLHDDRAFQACAIKIRTGCWLLAISFVAQLINIALTAMTSN
jgi:hypothetical protein